jgi:aspartate/methionine/tyrosine aminotransferase
VGVTAAESGTYTDFANINSGGLKADGSDSVNEVTYLILDVIDEMHLLQPSSNIQLSRKSPDRFLRRALEMNVAFVPGGGFFPKGNKENTLRLSYSNMPIARIEDGIRRLAAAVKELMGAEATGQTP